MPREKYLNQYNVYLTFDNYGDTYVKVFHVSGANAQTAIGSSITSYITSVLDDFPDATLVSISGIAQYGYREQTPGT